MGPLFLAVTFPVSSPEEYSCAEFSGRSLPETFPYSAPFGSTVDTCLRQLTRFCWTRVLTCLLLCWTVWSRQFRDLWWLHRSSSWPGCGYACRCTTGAWFDGAVYCGCLTVAFHRRSSTFVPPRQLSMVPPFRKTIEFPQLYVA